MTRNEAGPSNGLGQKLETRILDDTYAAAKNAVEHSHDTRFLHHVDQYVSKIQDALSREQARYTVQMLTPDDRGALHPARVAILSYAMVMDLYETGYHRALDSQPNMEDIIAGAILHDIGQTEYKAIFGSERKLAPHESHKKEQHVHAGAKILKQADFKEPVVEIALMHHKSYDGKKGYPSSNVPSINAQIVSLADHYAALTGIRNYRKHAYEPTDALTKMEKSKMHEPFLHAIFSRMIQKAYSIREN